MTALSWLLSPQTPGTGDSRAPGLGSSLLLCLQWLEDNASMSHVIQMATDWTGFNTCF